MSVFDLKKKNTRYRSVGLIGSELCYRLIKNNNKLIMIDHNFKKKIVALKLSQKKSMFTMLI